MLGPIKLYLGTRFLGGLKKLLDFAVLILRCSRHIALGQHLFPKLMKRTSLSMRSWQRQAGSLPRPSVNITTNRLFKETYLLPLSLTSENFDMFLEYYMGYFAYFATVRQYYKHGYHCLCSTSYFCVDFMPLVRVYVVWVHQHFQVSWDLCLLVM